MGGTSAGGKDMKKVIIAAISVTILSFTSSVASAQLCAVGVIAAAIIANTSEHRQLTAEEAWTCGLLYKAEEPAPKKKKVARHHRRAKRH
jgi:hypothetical protein